MGPIGLGRGGGRRGGRCGFGGLCWGRRSRWLAGGQQKKAGKRGAGGRQVAHRGDSWGKPEFNEARCRGVSCSAAEHRLDIGETGFGPRLLAFGIGRRVGTIALQLSGWQLVEEA